MTTTFSPSAENGFCFSISVIEDQVVESEENFLLFLTVGTTDDAADQTMITLLDTTGK